MWSVVSWVVGVPIAGIVLIFVSTLLDLPVDTTCLVFLVIIALNLQIGVLRWLNAVGRKIVKIEEAETLPRITRSLGQISERLNSIEVLLGGKAADERGLQEWLDLVPPGE
jgi:hypothetical protein